MSRPDSESGRAEDGLGTERLLRLDEFASDLNARGYTDVLVLRRENGKEVLTEHRLRLIRYLAERGDEIESVSGLARRLDRDKASVSRDLGRLAELDVIQYEDNGEGEAKRPMLKHDHVVIEPVL